VKSLNKQSRTAEKGLSSSLGLGAGLITPQRKNKSDCYKCQTGPQTLTIFFLERRKQRKMGMRYCTYNIRSLWRLSSLTTAVREKANNVSFSRSTGAQGRIIKNHGQNFLYIRKSYYQLKE
jgi:hypothetical protein